MAWKSILATTTLAAGLVGALQTSFSIRELQAIADDGAVLENQYRETSARSLAGYQQRAVVADTNPSLLYPAYNLSVPIDHFHNDSIYEPHVRPDLAFCAPLHTMSIAVADVECRRTIHSI